MPTFGDIIRNRVAHMVWDALEDKDTRTVAERISDGKALRKQVPRSTPATWQPAENRPDPVELLVSQGKQRVQELLPLRYERMAVSAFTFYRGGALIMASDLAHMPRTEIDVQAVGDAHISNFGLFSSPERRTVFDVNDFDETCRGPWEWDVLRLAASVEICGRDRAFTSDIRTQAVLACVRGYREAMNNFASMGNLDVWYAHADVDAFMAQFASQATKHSRKVAEKVVGKAKAKDSTRAVEKLTEVVDGKLRVISDPPVVVPLRDMVNDPTLAQRFGQADMEKLVKLVLAGYRKTLAPDKRRLVESYRGVDIARKVVGVGSVGTRCWIVVMEGAGAQDHLVLQIKEATDSVLERFVGKSDTAQAGQRVVEGQRAIQTASDMLLGWCRMPDSDGMMRDYYVRQLWDGKGSIDLDRANENELTSLAALCGWTLAHAHARTGSRHMIAGYLGKGDAFDRAVATFATRYADQNEADYARFLAAIQAGELS